MIRALISKVMKIGRVTVFAVGCAVVLAATLGIGTTALAAVPGDPFRLEQVNLVNAVSRLAGEVDGPMLVVDNDSTGPRATALTLQAEQEKPPLKVNAAAGTATNLSADELDGEEEAHTDVSNVDPSSSAGLAPNVTLPVSAGQHTVSLDAVRSGGTRDWSYTSNNLSVMFVPGGRAVVSETGA